MAQGTILLVEDSFLARKRMQIKLETAGYKVESAGDGKEALSMLLSNPGKYELIITDLIMPNMGGINLIERLRSVGAFQKLPIIVVTSDEKPETATFLHQLGVTEYFIKPIDDQFLLDKVNMLFSGQRYKILYVDDSATMRMIVQSTLTNRGYQVEMAENGVEAWNKIQQTQFSLLITDLEMPEMDGFSLIAKLRLDSKHKEMPVIVLTSQKNIQNVVSAKKLKVVDYILKPFEIDNFMLRVESILPVASFEENATNEEV